MNTPASQHALPTSPRSDFLSVLAERGFIHQGTDLAGLDERLATETVTAFVGFDATADSLHVGHLLSIMALRWLQRTGHRPIVLMGGGTSRIGDPSFRDTSRPLLDNRQIAVNIRGIEQVFDRILSFGPGPADAIKVNNAQWLDGLDLISFLRDIGAHFSVNRMLSFDSVKQRLERQQPMTFLEFAYMLLQAFDFVELSRRHGCCLQMGGSDQWGNIVNGVELGRRLGTGTLFGLTTPLLTTSSGLKMGKTAGGAVWLNPERLSPFHFWQFWRNVEDADVGRFLRLFTELPLDEIARLEGLGGREINEAKKVLATAVTALVHGEDEARRAADMARAAFDEGQAGEGLATLALSSHELERGVELFDALFRAGLCTSKAEARRLVAQGGATLDGRRMSEGSRVTLADLLGKDAIQLGAGKKRLARLVLVDQAA